MFSYKKPKAIFTFSSSISFLQVSLSAFGIGVRANRQAPCSIDPLDACVPTSVPVDGWGPAAAYFVLAASTRAKKWGDFSSEIGKMKHFV